MSIARYYGPVKGVNPRLPPLPVKPVRASWLKFFSPITGVGECAITSNKGVQRAYRVERLRDGANVYAWRFTVLSDPSKVYDVQLARLDGELPCDCPDAIYRGHERCKHVQAVAQLMAALPDLEAASASLVPTCTDEEAADRI